MDQTVTKENKMGTMPINALLLNMAIPIMISMMVQALYNIVDSLFVSRISENALTAVSLAFPIQNLMIAIATGTGVGINALLSRSLGENNQKEANEAAKNGIFLSFLSSIVFLFLGLLGSNYFFHTQTDIAEIINDGTVYLEICTVFSFGLFGAITFERLLQATGRTLYSMFTQIVGAVINIILDPILIFGLFGLPKLGIAGAALATVIGQIIGCILSAVINVKKNKEISLDIKGFRPNLKTIERIYSVGIPSIIMASISSIMTFGINNILMVFSSTATAVFGIYFKLQSFIFMPVFGLNNGMIPIIAYNYGAKKRKRITHTIKLSAVYATIIMIIGFFIFQTVPDRLLMMFEASEHMFSIGIPALRIISVSFIFAGTSIILSTVFQALDKGVFSLIISLVRQLIILLPLAYALSNISLDALWLAFPISDFLALLLSFFFLYRVYHQKLKNIPE